VVGDVWRAVSIWDERTAGGGDGGKGWRGGGGEGEKGIMCIFVTSLILVVGVKGG